MRHLWAGLSVSALLLTSQSLLKAQTLTSATAPDKICSTEKLNGSCTIVIDRKYPLSLPTFRMRRNASIRVLVANPLDYEDLYLDVSGAQLGDLTDQTQGFVSAALPMSKGAVLQGHVDMVSADDLVHMNAIAPTPAADTKFTDAVQLTADLIAETQLLRGFAENSAVVYAQLNEAQAVPSPQMLASLVRFANIGDGPSPWTGTQYWVAYVEYELTGNTSLVPTAKPLPQIAGLLTRGAQLTSDLAACPSDPDSITDAQAKSLACKLKNLDPTINHDELTRLQAELASFSPEITSILKDFNQAYVNLQLVHPKGGLVQSYLGTNAPVLEFAPIQDPLNSSVAGWQPKLPGVQATWTVSAINRLSGSQATVTPATQKKPIASFTVLFAQPIFEVSSGALFSTVPNRSFNSQTIATPTAGMSPTFGDVEIVKSFTRPAVVPFVAANWRVSPEFTWMGRRRGAFYLSTALGVNPYTASTDFAGGPSVSWRSVMFSAFYHYTHDVRLTQNEYANEILCNVNGPVTENGVMIQKCPGGAPSPTTEKYGTSAFAIGISIRIPSAFAGSSASASH
jgi:hypothetical protein